MTNQEYRNKDGISSSDFRLLEISPLHYHYKEHFALSGDNFTFGSLVHSLILEPEKFNDEYLIEPKFDLRTKQGKEDKKAFEEKSEDKIIVNVNDVEIARNMAHNVHRIAGGLLQNGIAEESFFVEDELGIKRKCRPDYYREDLGVVIDIKTTKSVNNYEFSKSIYEYKYHRQAAFYLDTLKLCGKPAERFIIIAVEKTAPYMVKIFELDKESIEVGRESFLNLLQTYKSYLETGKTSVIKKINLPEWAIKQNIY